MGEVTSTWDPVRDVGAEVGGLVTMDSIDIQEAT